MYIHLWEVNLSVELFDKMETLKILDRLNVLNQVHDQIHEMQPNENYNQHHHIYLELFFEY